MADFTSRLRTTHSSHAAVVSAFKSHTSGLLTDTASQVLDYLRSAYPTHHITEAQPKTIQLLDYAAAGKATATLDTTDNTAHAIRGWTSVGEGVQKTLHPGKLADEYRFARFDYRWKETAYLVYYVEWKDVFENPVKAFYVLSPMKTLGAGETPDGASPPAHHQATDALLLAVGKWTSQPHGEVLVFDSGYWSKSQELFRAVENSSWADVILAPETKDALIEDVMGFFEPGRRKLYAEYGVPWKRGVILHGVPGNGKTVSIKALMSSLANQNFSATKDGEEEEGGAGIPSLYVKSLVTCRSTEQESIREIFSQAREKAPCLLIFEDLDSLVGDKVRSYFLNEVDGLESNEGILMIGSTNHLDRLDPAISKRPSRFDRKYQFKLPGLAERRAYAEYWRKKLEKGGRVQVEDGVLEWVSEATEGFSFAYLKELWVMALLSLVRVIEPGEGDAESWEDVEGEVKDSVVDEKRDLESAGQEKTDGKTEVCICATTCATCHKPLAKSEEAAEIASEARTNARALADVPVPEHLANNLLLKVIKYHIGVLHKEMDNTKESSSQTGEKTV